MSARTARVGAAVVLFTALLGAGSGAAVAAPSTSPTSIATAAALVAMLPGEARTTAQTLTIPVRARVVSALWSTSGRAAWTVELCGTSTCIPFESLEEAVLPAGAHELRTTVRMAADAAQGATSSAQGEIRFVEDAKGLAATGGGIPAVVMGGGLGALLAGLLLLVGARQRKRAL